MIRVRQLIETTQETLEDVPVIKYVYEMHEGRMPWYDGCEQYISDHYDMLVTVYEAAETNELAQSARSKRDRLLRDTDYLMALDYPMGNELRERWRDYRQALRDITAQTGFPHNIQWPTKPDKAETEESTAMTTSTQNLIGELVARFSGLTDRLTALEQGVPYVPEEWPEWYRWGGIGDIPWNSGSKCTHEGKHYISRINNNLWEPGLTGLFSLAWEEVVDE